MNEKTPAYFGRCFCNKKPPNGRFLYQSGIFSDATGAGIPTKQTPMGFAIQPDTHNNAHHGE
jgi:hypothetical protein